MKRTVLVADDHADTVETTRGLLTCYDYEVFVAYDGRAALQIASEQVPNSILLDIALPIVDGFEVAKTLRESDVFSRTAIIGYSGHGGQQYYDRARTAGIDYYLLKPNEPEVLLACLDPETYPAVIAESVIVSTSKDLRQTSIKLLSKAQALSVRSADAVKRAQQIVRRKSQR